MGLSAAHRPGRHWGVFGSGFRRGAWERGVRPSGVPVGERWGEIRIVPSRPSVVPSCFPMLFPLQGTPFQASKFTIPSRRHARAHFFGGPDSGGLRTLPPWGGKSAPSKSSDSLNPLLLGVPRSRAKNQPSSSSPSPLLGSSTTTPKNSSSFLLGPA